VTDWLLTPERVAVHLPSSTAVLADPHWGYDETRRRSGEAVPAESLEKALAPLANARLRSAFRRLIIAGDLLERNVPDNFAARLLSALQQSGIELAAVVPGNHDRRLDATLLPLAPKGIMIDDWLVIHGDAAVDHQRRVQGHIHPCLRLLRAQCAPCFLVSGTHMVLPAFSKDAAGVSVLSLSGWDDYECHVCAADNVLNFGTICDLRKALRRRVEDRATKKPTDRHRWA
jgi:metallophosphoesterase superfamily enzyme